MNRIIAVLVVLLAALGFGACHKVDPQVRPAVVVRNVAAPKADRHRLRARAVASRHASFSAQNPASIVPSSWKVPAWYIDPSNASGCASDSNTGTSATCGANGQGPLLTWRELNAVKWGCLGNPAACPRLLQNTTINFLSSQLAPDPIIFTPTIENKTSTIVQCALGSAQVVATGTLGAVTSKNRAANQALVSTFVGGALDVGEFLINTTHPSRAWTVRDTGAGAWLLTQPLVSVQAPIYQVVFPTLVEVDTWASGDVVTAYAPISLHVSALRPTITDLDDDLTSSLYLQNCGIKYAPQYYSPGVNLGNDVVLNESFSLSDIAREPSPTEWSVFVNSFVRAFEVSTSGVSGYAISFGGGNGGGVSNPSVTMYDYDYVFGSSPEGAGVWDIGGIAEGNAVSVYVDQGGELVAIAPGGISVSVESSGIAGIYGPGSVYIESNSYLKYDLGTPAASVLLFSGGMGIGSSSTACSSAVSDGGLATVYCGIPLTATNLDAPAGPTGFGGNAFVLGRGSVSNLR